MTTISQDKLLQVHDFIQKLLKDHDIDIYIGGGFGIAFLAGEIYRENKDLDYIVDWHDIMKIRDVFLGYPEYIYQWITEKYSYKYIYDDLEIEFETIGSINTFAEKIANQSPNLSQDDIDIDNIYMLDWVEWKCMKPSYYYKLRNIFGGKPKYEIDKERLDKISATV